MRTDQASFVAAAEREHALVYANRWRELEGWCRIFLNGDFSTARYQSLRDLHMSRLLLLHQSLNLSMKIIRRWMLDDPRLTEPEMRERLQQYRMRKQVYDSYKYKKGK